MAKKAQKQQNGAFSPGISFDLEQPFLPLHVKARCWNHANSCSSSGGHRRASHGRANVVGVPFLAAIATKDISMIPTTGWAF